jgi:hypothetical protein
MKAREIERLFMKKNPLILGWNVELAFDMPGLNLDNRGELCDVRRDFYFKEYTFKLKINGFSYDIPIRELDDRFDVIEEGIFFEYIEKQKNQSYTQWLEGELLKERKRVQKMVTVLHSFKEKLNGCTSTYDFKGGICLK